MANDKYVILTRQTHGRFPAMLRDRIERGDSNPDIQFWVQSHYGFRVSHETIRAWRSRCLTEQIDG